MDDEFDEFAAWLNGAEWNGGVLRIFQRLHNIIDHLEETTMASPTKHDAPHAGSMKPTPGVGAAPATAGSMTPMAGQVAQTPETKGAEPVMVEGIDPVLLHRLFPEADSAADVEALALAQGKETWEQGATLVAAQNVPIPKTDQ